MLHEYYIQNKTFFGDDFTRIKISYNDNNTGGEFYERS